MHPSEAEGFEWNDGNEGELARHGIRPFEVEQVWGNDPAFAGNRAGMAGDWKMVGRTDGGRVLTIIVLTKPDTRTLRSITGYDSPAGDRTRYLRG